MMRAIRWKFLFLFILTVFSVLLILPSLPVKLPEWWLKHVSKGLNLGLDLKGGMHLVLEVDLQQAVNNALGRTAQDLGEVAEKRGLGLKVGEPAKEALSVTLLNKDEQAAFQKLLKEEFPQVQF